MKFGTKLRTFVVPEWEDKYIRYKQLSRLAKRAGRLKTQPTPRSEDEERELLENLFTIDESISEPRSHPLCHKFGSHNAFPGCEQEQAPRSASAGCLNVEGSSVIDLPYDCAGSKASISPFAVSACMQDESDLMHQSKDDSGTELVRLVAEQFEKEGHLSFATLRSKPENIDYLNKVLNTLEVAEQAADRKYNERLGDLHHEGRDIEGSSLSRSTSSKQVTISVASQSVGCKLCNGHRLGSSFSSRLGQRKPMKNHWRRLIRLEGLRRYCGHGPSRFNLSKHTPRMQQEALSMFNKVLRDDIRVVILHYVTEMEYIKALVRFLKGDIARRGKLDESYKGLIRKACTALWDSCDKLKLYLNLNTLAVYKALKKKDKHLATADVFNLYPTYKSILLSLDVSNSTVDEVAQIYNSLMDQVVVDFGILKSNMEVTLDSMRQKPAHGLYFIYGLCTVLLANSLFLCLFKFDGNFNLELLLSQIGNFRFFFIVSLVWWGFGWCQNYLETYGVNYQFQFGLSSNYAASENDYYLIAVFQMLTCLTVFVLFVLDCRLQVFSTHRWHFIYSIVLVFLSLIVAMWPNENLKLKMRRRLLMAVLRVIGAPFGVGEKVSLGDSIIADVMTSLTRPLRDLVFMITYFCAGMFSQRKVESPVVKTWIVPMVMSYPYVVRFSQCLRRYINEKRCLHLGNMAKYISGICCVVVSSIDWVELFHIDLWQRNLLVITFYVCATLFQCWWDYVVDWGLAISWNIFKTRQNRRMYRREAYYAAVVFNMMCRCTWALTTVPFFHIRNEVIPSDVLFLVVSVIEIVRRIVWVTFRLESEHLLNSYKYRTALWVPKLYNCKNLIVKEMKMLNEAL
ncbi:EXS family protein [Babesia divergens]|uniref:EXS family protein n=1 Tax=Babesia divergens TaxID=32595 RepID=A0AAD9GFF5_BABDI|nr:EXS family protein [Babesia divergens]